MGRGDGVVVRGHGGLGMANIGRYVSFSSRAMVLSAILNELAIGNRGLRVVGFSAGDNSVFLRNGMFTVTCARRDDNNSFFNGLFG